MYKVCICCGREIENETGMLLEDFYRAEPCDNCEMRMEELKEKGGESGKSKRNN